MMTKHVHMVRLIGTSRMADVMLTGRALDAPTAERFGVVNYLIMEGEAKAKGRELTEKRRSAACLW
jgi:enoyl-CoA hydratase/carnithine racemase